MIVSCPSSTSCELFFTNRTWNKCVPGNSYPSFSTSKAPVHTSQICQSLLWQSNSRHNDRQNQSVLSHGVIFPSFFHLQGISNRTCAIDCFISTLFLTIIRIKAGFTQPQTSASEGLLKLLLFLWSVKDFAALFVAVINFYNTKFIFRDWKFRGDQSGQNYKWITAVLSGLSWCKGGFSWGKVSKNFYIRHTPHFLTFRTYSVLPFWVRRRNLKTSL